METGAISTASPARSKRLIASVRLTTPLAASYKSEKLLRCGDSSHLYGSTGGSTPQHDAQPLSLTTLQNDLRT